MLVNRDSIVTELAVVCASDGVVISVGWWMIEILGEEELGLLL